MKTQSIVFVEKNRAELIEETIAPLGPKDVLVKLEYSTISSGTERANLVGDLNVSVSEIYTEARFPRRVGYSSSGVVVETGSEVTTVKPGDRVAASWGTHSRYVKRDERNVHKLSEKSSMRQAALALIGTFPLAAIRKCHLEIGESAIVMGQGVLGQIAVQILHAAGAIPVIAVDPIARKRERALELGADYALDPNDPDFSRTVKELTHGGANVAIEVTGIGKALDQVLDCMAMLGRVALLGCTRNSDFTIDYYHKVHGPGISLIGAHTRVRPKHESAPSLWTDHDDIMTLMRLADAGRIDLAALVEETHSPAEAKEIFGRLAAEPSFPVVQFDWSLLDKE